MADEKKGITVKIDADLHAEIREYLERHEGMTIPLRAKKRMLPQSPIRSRLLPSSLLRQRYGKKKKFRYICIPIPTRYSAKYSFPTEIFIPENSIRTMRAGRYCTDTVKCVMPTERPGTANGTTI